MEIDEKKVSRIVEEVISRLEGDESLQFSAEYSGILFDSMTDAITTAKLAQEKFSSISLEKRRDIISAMRVAALKESVSLAKLAYKETGMGRWEDKVIKNELAANKTPGLEDLHPEAFTGDNGLTLVERAPYGVIGAVTPSTNPSSTIINNAISIISAGNSVVFAPHPSAKEVSHKTMSILSDAICSAGGPRGLITSVNKPGIEEAKELFTHPDIRILLVTGGPQVVKAAMESNKRVIAAGPGNPPVVIDSTVVPEKAVDAVIKGASFDNGILCTAEKEVLITDDAGPNIMNAMRRDKRVYELTETEMDKLADIVVKKGGKGVEPVINRDFVGRDASVLAKTIGIDIDENIKLLWGCVSKEHVFMWTEQLMPVLPFAVAGNIDETIELAVEMEGGNGHTAIMHSLNVDHLTKMARKSACSIFVKNGSSYMGLGMGEGYATLSIATPTGEGLVKASTFTRPLRCVLVDYFRIT